LFPPPLRLGPTLGTCATLRSLDRGRS